MKTYLIPFLLASLFLAQNPAPAAVQLVRGEEYTIEYKADFKKHPEKAKLRSKSDMAFKSGLYAAASVALLIGMMATASIAAEGLATLLYILALVLIAVAPFLAFSALVYGLEGIGERKWWKWLIGIILGFLVLVFFVYEAKIIE
ncbi:MAG: hypothetical protein WA004_18075 [Saprospiraceae bacterium]